MIYYVIPFGVIDYLVMRRPRIPAWLLGTLLLIAVELIRVHATSFATQKFIYFEF
jgi:hypothetical protein